LLTSRGYDSLIVTPKEFDEKLRSDRFDLVILSAMLSQGERCHIQSELPASTRPLVLETLVWPDDLLRLVGEALR
jgi:DNA-binding response OmpR family regulator